MNISTTSTPEERRQFYDAAKEITSGNDHIFNWRLTHIEKSGAFVWTSDEHDHWHIYCTPFFDNLPMVMITYGPPADHADSFSAGDPNHIRGDLDVETYLGIVSRMFIDGMSKNKMPSTAIFLEHWKRVVSRKRKKYDA